PSASVRSSPAPPPRRCLGRSSGERGYKKGIEQRSGTPPDPQEEAEFFLMVEVLEERHAIDQARKGNTLFLIDYLQNGGDPHDRLRGYLFDVLLHKVRVLKPRPAVEKAHREYGSLAFKMAVGQYIRGRRSEEATRVLEACGVDHSKLERA